VFRNILVAYDASPAARAALAQALGVAQSQNGLGGVSSEGLQQQVDSWAARCAREAVESAPEGVIVHHIERSGRIGEEIVKELEERNYDLVVLGSRGRGRVEANVLGTVNGYVHYHSKIALLSVQAPDDAD
jgi:nucleotide-binding universal stress UspA family protein